MTHRLSLLAALVTCISLGTASRSVAQDIEPRTYSNAPIGVNFLIAGYAYTQGGLQFDPALSLTNANINTSNAVLAYARVLDLWGNSGTFDVVVPYTWLSGTATWEGEPVERVVNGFSNPAFRLCWNFHGAPALSLKEFASYQQDLIVGASVQVSIPSGQYDADKLVNIGSNRGFIKPELGLSKAWGPWTLELATAATFFADNEDFLGGKTREQDPIYSVKGGLIYGFRNGIWVALNGAYLTGGRAAVDGVEGDNRQKNSRGGVTVALPVDRNNSVKLYATTGISTRIGTDSDTIGIAWQYRWGGGL